MNNIFDYLHPSFFSVLTGDNKIINSDLLMQLHQLFEHQLKPTMDKEEVIILFTSFFEQSFTSVVMDEMEEDITLKSPREKAFAKYNLFRDRGWIHEEYSENYSWSVQLDSQAIYLLRALDEITKSDKSKEYTGYLMTILNLLENFKEDYAIASLEQIEGAVKALNDQLIGLNNKISKYLKKLRQDDENNVGSLLQTLLGRYQKEVVDQGFTNLKQSDHPSKFKGVILTRIDALLQSFIPMMVKNYRQTKQINEGLSDIEIEQELINRFHQVRDSIEELPHLVNTIDVKNSKYVNASMERIRFLLQESKNVQGLLEQCLKGLRQIPDESTFEFNFYSQKVIDCESLYHPPLPTKASLPLATLKHREVDEVEFEIQRQRFLEDVEWTSEAINTFIQLHLEGRNWIKASSLPYQSIKDIIRSLLIQLYSSHPKMTFTVQPLEETCSFLGYSFNDFVIYRKGETK